MNSGLEKILDKIESDCKQECDLILKQAEAEAKKIYSETVNSALEKKEEAVLKTRTECANKMEIARKGFVLERRNRILAVKNAYMDKVINEALSRVRSLDDEEFLTITKSLLLKHAVQGNGILRFSEKDAHRIRDGFIDEINSLLKTGGRHVEKGAPVNIKDGFIIEYGDININCTYEALLDSVRDEIREEVDGALFER